VRERDPEVNEKALAERQMRARLRAAELIPRERELHLKAADYYARIVVHAASASGKNLVELLDHIFRELAHDRDMARVSKAERWKRCQLCPSKIPRGGLYLIIFDSTVCKSCARETAGYKGPWRVSSEG
jgi:hypothetical protein